MSRFIEGALRSGMSEAVCHRCGRPWITRAEQRTLCPCCNPEHVGYQGPDEPSDAPRWVAFWRTELVRVLAQRTVHEALPSLP